MKLKNVGARRLPATAKMATSGQHTCAVKLLL
jgi:hypothetical protein